MHDHYTDHKGQTHHVEHSSRTLETQERQRLIAELIALLCPQER